MLGINSIVSRAVLLNDSPPKLDHFVENPLPMAEVDLQFQLAKLHLSLPKALSAELADVCAKIVDKPREEFRSASTQKNVTLNVKYRQQWLLCMQRTPLKQSILKHLPRTLVIHLDEFHTYCPAHYYCGCAWTQLVFT
jgi:hypothetical protein